MRRSLVFIVGVVAIVSSLALVACGGGGDEGNGGGSSNGGSSNGLSATINIMMNDVGDSYTMTPSAMSVAAGSITFDIVNEGLIAHEFKVVKLSEMGMDLTALTTEAGLIPESGSTIEGVGEILASLTEADLPKDGSDGLTLDLEAGDYLLLCNVATHYQLGMWSEFQVT